MTFASSVQPTWRSAFQAIENWIARVPAGEPIAVLFSGGVDSGSVLLLARQALHELGRDPDLRPGIHPRPGRR